MRMISDELHVALLNQLTEMEQSMTDSVRKFDDLIAKGSRAVDRQMVEGVKARRAKVHDLRAKLMEAEHVREYD